MTGLFPARFAQYAPILVSVTDNAGLMPGNAGRITTAAGGQTSSPIRRFLTEFYLSLSYLLNVSVFALPCWKKCPGRWHKMPQHYSASAGPFHGERGSVMQQLKQVKFFKLMDVTASFRGVVIGPCLDFLRDRTPPASHPEMLGHSCPTSQILVVHHPRASSHPGIPVRHDLDY